ncbi:hypothetical protein F2P56_005747 [Juglans regia]|uniref:Reverse transcriptase domain-containing protein n=1 Tax=Juglans regia TaxID=51240 RepID=A0A833XY74_JUGRE|nr:hypothetical protein F2P56_005747 [Juglans regia]
MHTLVLCTKTNVLAPAQTRSTVVVKEIPTSIARSKGDFLVSKGKIVSAQARDYVMESILAQTLPPMAQKESIGTMEASEREAGEIVEAVEGQYEVLTSMVIHMREVGENVEAAEGQNEILTSMVERGNCLEGSRQVEFERSEMEELDEQDRMASNPELEVAVYEEEMDSLSPLRMTPLQIVSEETSDWVFKHVEKIQSCVGLFYEGYEEQLRALLVAIEAVRFFVLVNGQPCGYFSSSRGLRQENPLSPFLFDIVMEALSRMVEVVVGAGLILGFSVGTNSSGPSTISHLLFADDTLIFCEAVGEQIQILRVVLLCFQAISGLKVNLSKSKLVPVGEFHNIHHLAEFLGCKVAFLPIKYLELLLEASFKAKHIWDRVIEKIERKLAAWKRTYLSKGGRITLIKSTLSNIPTYFLSLFPLPIGVANRI